jgi:hypothetical protein
MQHSEGLQHLIIHTLRRWTAASRGSFLMNELSALITQTVGPNCVAFREYCAKAQPPVVRVTVELRNLVNK